MSRYCSYLSTSALQYCASLDWANAAAGSANSATATMAFKEVFMISSIARSSSDGEMAAEMGRRAAFALRRPDDAKFLRRYNRRQLGVITCNAQSHAASTMRLSSDRTRVSRLGSKPYLGRTSVGLMMRS